MYERKNRLFRLTFIGLLLTTALLFSGCSKDEDKSSLTAELPSETTTIPSETTPAETTAPDDATTTTKPIDSTSMSSYVVSGTFVVTEPNGSAVTDPSGSKVTTVVTVVIPGTKPAETTVTPATTRTPVASSSSTTRTTTVTTVPTAATTTTTTTEATPAATEQQYISLSSLSHPTFGDCYGTISIPACNVNMDLYFGDDKAILAKGVGQYTGTRIPGRGSRILLCGHNSSGYLAGMKNVEVGDMINISTTYGDFQYQIYETKIASNTDGTAFNPSGATGEYVVLYTCYPFVSTYTTQRLVVYASKVSGPIIT